MKSELPMFFSIVSFLSSMVALHFTFRKDAHRVRLEATPLEFDAVALGVNNDSGCEVQILSVGFFGISGKVTWVDRVGDYVTNRFVRFPVQVPPRSLYVATMIVGRDVPDYGRKYGYCVQLSTGRFYVLRNTAPMRVVAKMHVASLLSRITGGRYVPAGIDRPRLPQQGV